MYKPTVNDIENENKLLSLIINKPERYFLVSSKVKADNLLNNENRIIYGLIEELMSANNTLKSLYLPINMELVKYGGIEQVGKKLQALKSDDYQLYDSSLPIVVEGVMLNSMRTKVANLSGQLQKAISGGTTLSALQDIITELSKAIILDDSSSDPITMEDASNALEEFHNADYATVPTGLDNLNDYLGGGLSRLHYIILAARPGMGKTTAICFLSIQAALSGTAVAIASLEETAHSLYARMCSFFCDTSYGDILNNRFKTNEHKKRYKEADERVKKLPIFIYDTDRRSSDIGDILNVFTIWKRTRNIGLIFADHIGLMQDRSLKTFDLRNKIETISSKLRMWQKSSQIPLVVASQLSRAVESRTDKRPMISDLRESGALEQDAVGVLMLYRDDYYAKKLYNESGSYGDFIPKNEIEFIWGKYRFGDPQVFVFGCDVAHTKIYRIGSLKERNEPKPYIPPVLPIENSFGISTTMKAHNTEELPF